LVICGLPDAFTSHQPQTITPLVRAIPAGTQKPPAYSVFGGRLKPLQQKPEVGLRRLKYKCPQGHFELLLPRIHSPGKIEKTP